jgi:alkanesulfonate monooxygenase SsuD/methylene tetrahydromethanopterin reductase-like flavin-dependent oxidoreductase (luciferase family)
VEGATVAARVRFGVCLSNQHTGWDDYLAAARVADELRFDALWMFDHLLPVSGDMDGSCFETYTTLAAVAAATKRIRLGAFVTGVSYRNPAMQIKLATQIDVISNGRLNWGVGAGWAEREFRAFDIPFGTPGERLARLRETLELAEQLWSGDPRTKVTYEGEHVRASDLFINPQPVQRPRPPIFVAGGGERVTLRIAARHADMWHGMHGDEDALRRKIALLDGYARECGRDPRDIVKIADLRIIVGGSPAPREPLRLSYANPTVLSGHPEEIASRIREVVDGLGITYFIVMDPGRPDLENWRRISELVIPLFDD